MRKNPFTSETKLKEGKIDFNNELKILILLIDLRTWKEH